MNTPPTPQPDFEPARIDRPPNLVAQVERFLRQAIRSGRYTGRMPTDVEIAQQLGVSRETVRRATKALAAEGLLHKFRRKGTFLAGTVEAGVLPAAALLGYVQADYRDHDGRREPTMQHIGRLLLDGALDVAAERGHDLAVCRGTAQQLGTAVRRLVRASAPLGLLCASVGEEKLLRRVLGLGLPVVLLDHDVYLADISSVRDDSASGARLAVEHLAALGHRRIAIANWHVADLNPWRLDGYREALRDLRLPRRRAWEMETALNPQGAEQVVQRLLNVRPRPTGLYCFNNALAGWVIEALQRHGLHVPRDISVVGGGGPEVVGLTHHQADWYAMGRRGMALLLEAIAAEPGATPVHELHRPVLHVGTTTAAPPVA